MPWRVVEKKIGRAGGLQQRTARQREWDGKYGEGNWEVGYVIDSAVRPPDRGAGVDLLPSYEEHFAAHPEDLEELVRTAKKLRNPHAEATTGVDLQVPAIMTYLERHGLASRATRSSTSARGRGGPRTRSASGSARSRSRPRASQS